MLSKWVMPWDMLLRCLWSHTNTPCTCQRRTHCFTGGPLIFGKVELATQKLEYWHCLTSAARWCAKHSDGVQGARAVHVQTIRTLDGLPSSLRAVSGNGLTFETKRTHRTYITLTIDNPIVPSPGYVANQHQPTEQNIDNSINKCTYLN